MLQIDISATELYDEVNNEFITTPAATLHLEHSLISISKWESKWKKPFLDPKTSMTTEQSIDYIRCMTLDKKVDPNVYYAIDAQNMKLVNEYINSELTATWFSERTKRNVSHEIVTSELIYYWMVAYQIPWEAQKWHISRLLTLITICNIKNQPPKKMSKGEILRRNRALNAARRKAHHTKG